MKYFLLNKPYGVLTQFTDKENRKTLGDLYTFPANVYPVGRLDMDSEGLLLLTDDRMLNNLLLNPKFRHEREYLVQVEGIPGDLALQKLRRGVLIENKQTLPTKVELLDKLPDFPERIPPVRFRKNIPDSWIKLILYEGRNRQVRKMTAAVGHPTLRLIRTRIENLESGNLKPGEVRELNNKDIKLLLRILKQKSSETNQNRSL